MSKDKGRKETKTPKATHNVKAKGQTPLPGASTAAGAKAVATINHKATP